MSGPTLSIRQQIAPRPGTLYCSEPRSINFTQGSLFSFPLHSTAYESDAATIRIPAGIKLCINSVSVDRKEMTEFAKTSGGNGVVLKFSCEENADMVCICICVMKFDVICCELFFFTLICSPLTFIGS